MNRSAINTAIFGRLTGGTALMALLGGTATPGAINFQNAPDNKALPYVVFDYTARIDENLSPHRTVNAVSFVRAYASTPVQASQIDAEIDTLLHNKPLTITGVTSNFWLARESSYDIMETDAAGRKIYACGGEYRIRLDI